MSVRRTTEHHLDNIKSKSVDSVWFLSPEKQRSRQDWMCMGLVRVYSQEQPDGRDVGRGVEIPRALWAGGGGVPPSQHLHGLTSPEALPTLQLGDLHRGFTAQARLTESLAGDSELRVSPFPLPGGGGGGPKSSNPLIEVGSRSNQPPYLEAFQKSGKSDSLTETLVW